MKGIAYICLVLAGLLLLINADSTADQATDKMIVTTKHGKVRGHHNTKKKTREFKGIPYGGSVSGKKRWTCASPPESWDGIKDCVEWPVMCPQTLSDNFKKLLPGDVKQAEDCLFLNVFTPENANKDSKLPVMVYIHGGSYVIGYSGTTLYDANYLVSHSNIIVVNINYRLGALGFLVYPDKSEGNFGIKDQILALEWVQDNIEFFGGDKGKVTVSGESAGAMSVAVLLTLKPYIEGAKPPLFKQAILESDPFKIMYDRREDRNSHGKLLAKGCGCENDWDCLQKVEVDKIVKSQDEIKPHFTFSKVWSLMLSWAPVISDEMLPDQPIKRIKAGKVLKTPLLMGTNTAEGIVFVYTLFDRFPDIFKLLMASKPCTAVEIAIYSLSGITDSSELMKKYTIKQCHDFNLNDGLDVLSKFFTDYAFTCPNLMVESSISAKGTEVYSYIFDHPDPLRGKQTLVSPLSTLCAKSNHVMGLNLLMSFILTRDCIVMPKKNLLTLYQCTGEILYVMANLQMAIIAIAVMLIKIVLKSVGQHIILVISLLC